MGASLQSPCPMTAVNAMQQNDERDRVRPVNLLRDKERKIGALAQGRAFYSDPAQAFEAKSRI